MIAVSRVGVTLIILFAVAESAFAYDIKSIYVAGMEGRDCDYRIVKDNEGSLYEAFKEHWSYEESSVVMGLSAGVVVFHGGSNRNESLYITSDSRSGIEIAAAGLIEGMTIYGSGTRYRIKVRILGKPEYGIMMNCESGFVDESDLKRCINETVKRAVEGFTAMKTGKSGGVEHLIRKEANMNYQLYLNPYFMLNTSCPLGLFGDLCDTGIGFIAGGNICSIKCPWKISIHQSVRLSMTNYLSKRKNVDSLMISRLMLGSGPSFDYEKYSLWINVYGGYQIGKMKFRRNTNEEYLVKYYHAPVVTICTAFLLPFEKADLVCELSLSLFREKGITGREVSLSAGGVCKI